MDAIKNLDVIGSEFKFKIEGGKLKTFIGGVITLVLLVISIITFLYFGQDLYLRVNPKYYTKQARTTEYPVKTLNSSQLFFAFAIKDQDNNPIDDQSYFVHNFNYITFLRDNTTGKMVQTTITTQMERCSTKHIEEYYLKKYELNTYYCHYFKELKLGGDFHANEMYIYKYSIDRCDSDISAKYGVICNDEDSVLDKYRDNIHIDSYLKKSLVNPNNFSFPIQEDYEYRYELYDLNSQKENRLYYANASVVTDSEWVFTGHDESNFNQYDYIETYGGHIGDKEANSLSYLFYFTKNVDYHYRTYIKIPDLLAVVGGLMSIVHKVIGVIYSVFVEVYLKLFLFNNLCEIHEVDDKLTHLFDVKTSSKKLNNNMIELNQLNAVNIHDNSTNNMIVNNNLSPQLQEKPINYANNYAINQEPAKKFFGRKSNKPTQQHNAIISEYYKKTKKVKTVPINISYLDYFIFNYMSCCMDEKGKRYKNFELVELEINKKMDIVHLLKKLDKFNNLKKAVLNRDQRFMLENKGFKILNKYINFVDIHRLNDNSIKFELFQKQLKDEQIKLVIKYLKDKNEDNSLNYVDSLLFIDLENDLKFSLMNETNVII